MGSYAAIAETSETLLELLRAQIADRSDVVDIDRNDIVLASPGEVGDDSSARLSLYLYGLDKNRDFTNSGRRVMGDTVQNPPVALDLYYLLTAYPSQGTERGSATIDQQQVLGLAIQAMNDNAIIEFPRQGDASEGVTVGMQRDALDRVLSVWGTFFRVPYYPSVVYHVSPVLVESRVEETVPSVGERELRVRDKDEDAGRSETRAPDS